MFLIAGLSMRAIIHESPNSPWQPRYGAAIAAGLSACGIKATRSCGKTERADLTVVLGPHWCLDCHRDTTIIYIDRAFWGDPDAISLHWMIDGEKVYDWAPREGRPHPDLQPMKRGSKTVLLNDYRRYYSAPGATVRMHPAESITSEPLADCLRRHDIAIGGRSTALVDAAIAGLVVESREQNSPVAPISGQANPDRKSWIIALSWHNWTHDELQTGAPWRHLLKSKP